MWDGLRQLLRAIWRRPERGVAVSLPGRHARARAGGGNTDNQVAKFLSRSVPDARTYTGPARNRNSRRKRRDRATQRH